jgi:hypothetical protein
MVGRSSLFAQVVSRISRRAFDAAVREHGAEKGAKGFTCWEQFVAMLYAQMAGAHSLREICGALATALGKLAHLGMAQAPSRSTLSYANARRSWRVFESVFYALLGEAQGLAARQQRRSSMFQRGLSSEHVSLHHSTGANHSPVAKARCTRSGPCAFLANNRAGFRVVPDVPPFRTENELPPSLPEIAHVPLSFSGI